MHEFVKIALVIAIVGGAFIVTAQFHAFGLDRTLLAQITLDPPDRQPGATPGPTQPAKKKPESAPATLPVSSIALDPPINQADELGLGSASPITSIERLERGTVPLAQPTSGEQSAPVSAAPPAVSSPQPPAPASPAASIVPPPAQPAPAPVAEPRDQDKNEKRGRREDDDNKGKWSGGDKKGDRQGQGYRDGVDRDGPDGSYRIERADKVDRTDKVDRPEKIEKVDRVEKIEVVRPERVEKVEKVEKIEKVEKSGRPEKVERIQKIEKPERGKH